MFMSVVPNWRCGSVDGMVSILIKKHRNRFVRKAPKAAAVAARGR
jgi:hypothetical protein